MRARIAVSAARIILGLLLVAAGWPKAREPGAFIRDIWNFHLLPEGWAYSIAAAFPYLEIAAGIALITGLQRRGAHLWIAAMLPVFLVFHASAWARGLDLACGCFGSTNGESSAAHPAWWIALIIGMGVALGTSIWAERRTAAQVAR